MIESGYIRGRRGHDLFVHTRCPEDEGKSKNLCLICPPVLEERVYCRLDTRGIAERLVRTGIQVVEFDYAGTGDSTGEHAGVDLNTFQEDIRDVLHFCRDSFPGVDIRMFGIRTGGNLCLDIACSEGLNGVAWFPITDGRRFVSDCYKLNLSTQYATFGTVRKSQADLERALAEGVPLNVQGFDVSRPMLDQLSLMNLEHIHGREEGKLLVILQQNREAEIQQERLSKRGIEVRIRRTGIFWQSPRIFDPEHAELVDESMDFLT